MAGTTYETDVVAWAQEQARLLRAGRFDALDIEHIAEEIEDVAKSEQRELERRLAVLLAHLLKWQHQPECRRNSWRRMITDQRTGISRRLKRTPSLKASLQDPDWWADAWLDGRQEAVKDGIEYETFPETCPWTITDILDPNWLPNEC